MRIIAIGNLEQTDLVCTFPPAFNANLDQIILTIRSTDSGAESYMWSQIEPSAAIFGACIVTYRPLFRDVRMLGYISKFVSARTEDSSDVSRRWPASGDSEKGSEAGFVLIRKE